MNPTGFCWCCALTTSDYNLEHKTLLFCSDKCKAKYTKKNTPKRGAYSGHSKWRDKNKQFQAYKGR